MVLTLFKSEGPNLSPKVILYRKCKRFGSDKFKLEVLGKLSIHNPST